MIQVEHYFPSGLRAVDDFASSTFGLQFDIFLNQNDKNTRVDKTLRRDAIFYCTIRLNYVILKLNFTLIKIRINFANLGQGESKIEITFLKAK